MPDAPLRIRHDPQRIGQVVANLVGNALKFTPNGGSVSVEVRSGDDGARIEVRDTGVGIDAEELPRIFERFYRGSQVNEARGSGSGLGLAIVRSIVEMHGGTVTVESRIGAGSRFTVMLPRDTRTPEEPLVAAPVFVREIGEPLAARSGAMPEPTAADARPLVAGNANMADSSPTDTPRVNPGPSPSSPSVNPSVPGTTSR
jgi:anti-sigma regulatory factor (Ser/Thr protein kinase)